MGDPVAISPDTIRYTDSVDGITAEQLGGPFFVGWPNPPPPVTHLRLLRGSDHVVVAVDEGSGAVVGFVTAISDGVLAAFIPFLEVVPAYQSHGIASELMRRMLARLRHLYSVDLFCDPELQPYYERFGMQLATGMLHRNYDRQSGNPA